MTPKSANPPPQVTKRAAPSQLFKVRRLTKYDLADAFKAGLSDFLARPMLSGSFGLFFAAFGPIFVWSLVVLGQLWLIVPAIFGFPLIAPFAAAGLYEMSRRLEDNAPFGWRDILVVMFDQRKRELGWMAFVTLFIFWVWAYQIRLWLAILLKDASFSDLGGFANAIFFTPDGWLFLAIGTVVGAILNAVLFSVTILAMPLLLDRETDFVTAMLTSINGVRQNPVVMLGWAAIVGATILVSMLPAFLGLLVTLPVLGHTTWHLYRRTIDHTEQ